MNTPMKTERILIADDDADARALVALCLRREGRELWICEDGEQALARCQEEMPDLAILDVQMPNKNGLDVCAWLKAQPDTFVPVMLLTSQRDTKNKVEGFECGADDYVTKPFAHAELEARVHAFMRIKHLTDELRRTQNLLAEKDRMLVANEVAGATAHELGQPLTTLLLHVSLLPKLEPESDKFRLALTAIKSESDHMRDILRRLAHITEYKTKDYTGDIKILDLQLLPTIPVPLEPVPAKKF